MREFMGGKISEIGEITLTVSVAKSIHVSADIQWKDKKHILNQQNCGSLRTWNMITKQKR